MHLPSVTSHPAAEVVALCGRTKAPAERLAAKYGIPAIYSDYRDMLDKAGLDAVMIATPDDSHHPIALRALDKRLHVLCEKPLANSLADAEAMVRAAEAAGVTHMTFFGWRWNPVWAALKRHMDQNGIGRCHEARFAFLGDGAWDKDYAWRRDATRCNGVVADFGAHMIDFVRWYLDDIESVGAHFFTHRDHAGNEPAVANDTAHLDIMTGSGTHVTIELNVAAHLGDQRYRMEARLYGAHGTYEAELILFGAEGGATLRRRGAATDAAADAAVERLHHERFPPDFDQRPAFFAPYVESSAGPRAFIDAILAGRPADPSLIDGLEAQRMIAAAIESDRTGRVVTLSG